MDKKKFDDAFTPPSGLQICSACGHQNPGRQKHCGECGAELKTSFRKIVEGTRAFGEGPRTQITLLSGCFGGPDGIDDPEVIQDIQRRLLGRIRLVITESGGLFQDHGRGVFSATLGADDPTEEDPLSAVTLGLKLLRLVVMAKETPPLRQVVVTGRVPIKSLRRDSLGDPILDLTGGHALSRMARKILRECPPGALFVDRLTHQMIRDTHRCRRVTEIPDSLTGQTIYEVSSDIGTTDAILEPNFVGREKEMARLMGAFKRVLVGEGPIFFTLTGGLGVGKTRLGREFLRQIESKAAIFKTPSHRRRIDRGRRTPYSFIGEILRDFFDIHENEDPEKAREKLLTGLLAALPPESKGVPREMSHFIGLLCQVDFPDSPYLATVDDDPAQLERRAFSAFTHYLERCSASLPLVFLLDDLYTADHSSLRLLCYLAENLERSPALFCCISRSEFLAELEKQYTSFLVGERLVLDPLDRDAGRQLIQEMLFEDLELPEALSHRILNIAEGNPFFLRETLRDLSEQGLLEDLETKKAEDLEIPGTIEGILQARISRLSQMEREVLVKASVFGKTFWRGGVEMLYRHESEMPEGWRLRDGVIYDRSDDLDQHLSELVHKGFLQRQSESPFAGETQYHFAPSLLQELIYLEIPKDLLAPYHRLVAQWLEVVSRGQGTSFSEEIAHHFDLGGEHSRAALYHLEVGDRARRVYDTERAIHHLQLGLENLDGQWNHQRIQATRQLAEAYILNGDYQKAITRFREALSLSWRFGLRVLAGEAYTRLGWVYFLMRDFQSSLESMKNGHALHVEIEHARGIANALSNMGQVYTTMGDYQKARTYLKEALDLRRDLGNQGDLAWTLNNMGNLMMEQGKLDEARAYQQEALEIRKEVGNPQLIIQSMNNVALINLLKGDYDAALADLLMSSNLAQKVGDKLGMAVVLVNIGELYFHRDELDQARKYLDRALHLAQKLDDKLILSETYRIMGEIFLAQGEGLAALDCCGMAYTLIMERGIRSALAGIYRLMGEVYAALPREVLEQKGKVGGDRAGLPPFLFGNASACFEESISLAHNHGNLREEARSRMALGIYEVNRGNIVRGRYQLDLAYSDFGRLGMEQYRKEAEELLAEIDQFQEEEERRKAGPAATPPSPPPPPATKKSNLVAQTMRIQMNFDEDEVGPPPTPASEDEVDDSPMTEEEMIAFAEEVADEMSDLDHEFHRGMLSPTPPPPSKIVAKPFFLPEMEEFRRAKESSASMEAIPASELPAPEGSTPPPPSRGASPVPSSRGASPVPSSLSSAPSSGSSPTRPPAVRERARTLLQEQKDLFQVSESPERLASFEEEPPDELTYEEIGKIQEKAPSSLPHVPEQQDSPTQGEPTAGSTDKMEALEHPTEKVDALGQPTEKVDTWGHAVGGDSPQGASSGGVGLSGPPTEEVEILGPEALVEDDEEEEIEQTAPMTPVKASAVKTPPPPPASADSSATPRPASTPAPAATPTPPSSASASATSTSAPPSTTLKASATPTPVPSATPATAEEISSEETTGPPLSSSPTPTPSTPPPPSGISPESPASASSDEPLSSSSKTDTPAPGTAEDSGQEPVDEEMPTEPVTPQMMAELRRMAPPSETNAEPSSESSARRKPIPPPPPGYHRPLPNNAVVPPPPPDERRATPPPSPRRRAALADGAEPHTTPPPSPEKGATPPPSPPHQPPPKTPPSTPPRNSALEDAAEMNLEDVILDDEDPEQPDPFGGGRVDSQSPEMQSPQKNSVYDSQVIIVQVAEDDPISQGWFEEGRSDRTEKFWRSHKEDLKEVKEEMVHEKVLDEIDELDVEDD